MNSAADKYGWLDSPQVSILTHHQQEELQMLNASASQQAYVSLKHEGDKVLVFERAGLLFVFNFHPVSSYTDYRVGVEVPGEYKIVLSTDEKLYGGFDNIKTESQFFTTPLEWNGRKNYIQVCKPTLYFLLSVLT